MVDSLHWGVRWTMNTFWIQGYLIHLFLMLLVNSSFRYLHIWNIGLLEVSFYSFIKLSNLKHTAHTWRIFTKLKRYKSFKGTHITQEQESKDSLPSFIFPIVLPNKPDKGGNKQGGIKILGLFYLSVGWLLMWTLTMPSLDVSVVGPKHGDSQGEGLRNHGFGCWQLPPSAPHPKEQSTGCTQNLLNCGEERKKGTELLKMTGLFRTPSPKGKEGL